MDRLTKYSKETTHENGVCCTHLGGMECFACNGDCSRGCTWEEAAWSRLAAYEDTGLTPEEVERSKLEIEAGCVTPSSHRRKDTSTSLRRPRTRPSISWRNNNHVAHSVRNITKIM